MKRILFEILVCLPVLLTSSCAKEVLVPVAKSLGTRTVGAAEGRFPVRITTAGVWKAYSDDAWIMVDGRLHKDEDSFEVQYASNESMPGDCRFNRVGRVVVKTHDGATADTLYLRQRGNDPFISFHDCKVPAEGGACTVTMYTNLTDECRKGIRVESMDDWISSPKLGNDIHRIEFTATPGSARNGRIRLTFTDDWGIATAVTCNIIQ